MAQIKTISRAEVRQALPEVRKIGLADLKDALARGFKDFLAIPSYVAFIWVVYPIVGLVLWRATIGYDILPMVFPLAEGAALLGPFAALGLYELSRRREQGLDCSLADALQVFRSPSIGHILALGGVLLALFLAWLGVARSLYTAIFGDVVPASLTDFARQIFTTEQGQALILLGSIAGVLFATLVLAISVVSFPLLLDRNVGAPAAALTSIKACLRNPVTMLLWGLIVVSVLVLGALPFFIGLIVVLPWLGHSTWHLYRKVVRH